MEIFKLSLLKKDCDNGSGFQHQFSVNETYPLHSHLDFYEVFLVLSGKAIHYVNGESLLLSEGSFVLVRPTDIHKYEPLNQLHFEMVSVGFLSEKFVETCKFMEIDAHILDDPPLPPSVILEGYNMNDMARKLLHIALRKDGTARRNYFFSILPQLLYRFVTTHDDVSLRKMPIWICELILEMNKSENFIAGLPRMLEISRISQEHLTREFKKYLFVTPTEFINAKRMGYAAQLLSENKHEVIDICFMSGFNNLSHFYHVFKEVYGCSPKKFKKN